MRRFLIVSLIGVIISQSVSGQEFIMEFGRVGKEEIEMKTYPQDTVAEALVLFDLGKSHFARTENSFDLIFERHTRIKILKSSGTDWAEVSIPLYRSGDIYEKIVKLSARAYNFEDGQVQVVDFDPSMIVEEKVNENWILKKFVVPAVKKGTVLEYVYSLSSQYMFNLRDWEFQWTIPVKYSEYETRMIPFYEYVLLLQGQSKYDIEQSYIDHSFKRVFGPIEYNDMVYRFGMKDLPAFRDESFITSPEDYLVKLDFQLAKIKYPSGGEVDIITTWPDLADELNKDSDFGRFISKSEKMSGKLIPDIESLNLNDEARFNLVLNYVKANLSWDGRNGIFARKAVNDLVKDKFGSSAEINLFTAGAMRAAGLNARAVIISTRDHGKIWKNYPFMSFFNYVIILVEIQGDLMLADATEVFCPNFSLPPRCINDMGLIIEKNSDSWVEVKNHTPSSEFKTFTMKPKEGNQFSVKYTYQSDGFIALDDRKKYLNDQDKLVEDMQEKGYKLDPSSLKIDKTEDMSNPFSFNCDVSYPVEYIADKLYINPFLNESPKDSPLKQPERVYPIDMITPIKESFSTNIEIPDGYKVDYLPEKLTIRNDLFEMQYSVVQSEGNISLNLSYFFKKSIYPPSDYKQLKYYFNEIIKKSNEHVVLIKI